MKDQLIGAPKIDKYILFKQIALNFDYNLFSAEYKENELIYTIKCIQISDDTTNEVNEDLKRNIIDEVKEEIL